MIVYVVPYLEKYGGIQTFSTQVYQKLKGEFPIKTVSWSFSHVAKILKKIFNSFPALYYLFLHLRIPRQQKTLLEKADFIHFWHPLAAIGFEKKRFIVSCHGREILLSNLESCDIWALKKVFTSAEMIHANSRFTKKLLLKNFPFISRDKVKIIYPGIALPNLDKVVRRKRKGAKKIIIGTLTRFNPRKNIPKVIDSLNILKTNYQLEFEYYLAGRGMEGRLILDKLKKAQFVWHYFRNLSDKRKVSAFYSKLDIFVLPILSLSNDVEGFGMVCLEANSFGIPVVASKVDGVREAVKEGVSGVFCDPTSPEAIARSIHDLACAGNKYSQSARSWAKLFPIEKTAKEFAGLYRQCLVRKT